jgi:prolyl-tRNA synthetase
MRVSRNLGRTFRQPPAEAQLASHQLLVRAGLLRAQEAGQFAYLPLGTRTLRRLQRLVRHGLGDLEAQEIGPLPATRGASADAASLVQVAGREIDSYRQLPVLLLQWESRVVPQASARLGVFGASERPVASLTALGGSDLPELEPKVAEALGAVLAGCEVPAVWAKAGGGARHACVPHMAGDMELVRCPACGDASERSWATPAWPDPPPEDDLPPEEIATPGCDTIAALSAFLGIPPTRTLKMVFYSVEGRVTCAVIRGDRKVDEAKLARVLGTARYYTSVEDELAAAGAVGGYASPIGLDPRHVRVVADPSVRSGRNYVSGANRPDYHIRNVNVPRDFEPGEWADLALVEPDDSCPRCGEPLQVESAFLLVEGTSPAPVEAEYRDEEGHAQALWMARWQLDLGRLMAATAEAHHDEYGLRWPTGCAPFDVHVVALDLRDEAVAARAEALYGRLQAEGLAVLYDDRDASAGVKFNDADLIGIPLRLTASKRWLAEGRIEAKWRASPERLKLDEEGLAAELARLKRPRA